MSGTSLDGVDCVIVDKKIKLQNTHYLPYPQQLKEKLQVIIKKQIIEFDIFTNLNIELANFYAQVINECLIKANLSKSDIIAIGSHGQTIYHDSGHYSLQIGHPAIIAKKTGINVVADFRMSDIAIGGEGAPLTPIFHKFIVNNKNANIINLGGITNITKITANKVIGFDTGPANTLLDNWIRKHKNLDYDRDGLWARSGFIDKTLLNKLLSDDYFKKSLPKSTGIEYFNLNWLEKYLIGNEKLEDVQRTLLELTVQTITDNIDNSLPIYLCGGGVHNNFLVERIEYLCPNNEVSTTDDLGINPDYLEAMAFAYFARETINNQTITTTNNQQQILGGLWKH
ncbi:Anhydro-N-acetylmuramic acid kinase [hydrothermal vent metagenome]|uniref:Anhydro-N-acetylmuramic acid kinase n=1 Tax=hydrothermal vent metagenome TaxID=652676 RepID=A0A1W1BGR2_9ZZZZ